MKKLLKILSILTISSVLTTQVVSCENKYDKKDKDYNSIWAYLPGLKDHKTITSADVWNSIGLPNNDDKKNDFSNIPGSIKNIITENIMKIFDVSILAQAGDSEQINNLIPKEWQKDGSFKDVAGFGNEKLAKILKADWNQLKGDVEQSIKTKQDELKDKYGNNKWKSHWNDFLKDKYDGDENNYKADLYANGDVNGNGSKNSAASLIQQSLLADQTDFEYVNDDTLIKLINTIIKNKTSLNNEIKNTQWCQLWVALRLGYKNDKDDKKPIEDIKNKIKSEIKKHPEANSYNDLIEKDPKNFAIVGKSPKTNSDGKNYETFNDFIKDTYFPTYTSATNLKGMLSPFQLFAENNWFKNKKPLATSDILVKYDNKDKFDIKNEPLNGKSIDELFSKSTINNLKKVFYINSQKLGGSEIEYYWKTVMKRAEYNTNNDPNIIPTWESNLLTPDYNAPNPKPPTSPKFNNELKLSNNNKDDSGNGFGTGDYKAATYNSVNKNLIVSDKNSEKEIRTIDKLFDYDNKEENIEEINRLSRTDNDSMYQVYKMYNTTKITTQCSNVIVYFDNLGLHIIHVDGSSLNPDDNFLKPNKNPKIAPKKNKDNYQYLKDYKNEEEFKNIYNFNKNKIDKFKKNRNKYFINNRDWVTNWWNQNNEYEKWLNNNQKSDEKINYNVYNFSVNDNISKYANNSALTNQMPFWDYNIMEWYLGTSIGQKDWMNHVLKFNNEEFKKIFFEKQIEIITNANNNLYMTNLSTELNNENKTNRNNQENKGEWKLKDILNNTLWVSEGIWDINNYKE